MNWRGKAKRWGDDWVRHTAYALITLHMATRAVLAFGGYFYWDDLILIGHAGTNGLLSPSFLFNDHDGHVMPAAFFVAGAISKAAPFNWIGPALSLVVLQLIASLALLRALRVILGWRPVLLIPLTFALFTPLALPAFAWWAAALNALPMIAAMAWVCADAILLVRTGNQRYALTGVLAFLGGLLFFEKAAIIPFVAFAVTALLAHVTGSATPLKMVWERGFRLWTVAGALITVWIGVYLLVVDQRRWTLDGGMTAELLVRSFTLGIVPGLVGGPWEWGRWAPSSPWASPPLVVIILGWLVLAAVIRISVARKERIGVLWLAALGYAAVCQVPIFLMRSSELTALELAQTLRYLPDFVVVVTLLAAIGFVAPNKVRTEWMDASRRRSVVVVSCAVLFIASCLYSTTTFMASWRDNPTRSFLHNAFAGLAEANASPNATMLDQEIDPHILQRPSWPANLASHIFALVRDRPEFTKSTTELRFIDQYGRLVDAQATWVRYTLPGSDRKCAYQVKTGAPIQMPLSGPLLHSEWTTELNYIANTDGTLTMALSDGTATRVPVRRGLNRVFVRLSGGGDAILVRADTSALSVCLGYGPIGYVAPP